jgi:hypothetical protein
MGWAHAAAAMEEVLGLVRGFVGLLVLAGGRTSSGAAATWSLKDRKWRPEGGEWEPIKIPQ